MELQSIVSSSEFQHRAVNQQMQASFSASSIDACIVVNIEDIYPKIMQCNCE